MNKRDIALRQLDTHLGRPYKWGGNDTIEGFDCSGLVVEVLQAVGIIPNGRDYTANSLSKLFNETDYLMPGNLVYWDWNNDGVIDHVEMISMVSDSGEVYTIGASGGRSNTLTPALAALADAFVKFRPLRPGYKLVNDPFAGLVE